MQLRKVTLTIEAYVVTSTEAEAEDLVSEILTTEDPVVEIEEIRDPNHNTSPWEDLSIVYTMDRSLNLNLGTALREHTNGGST